MFDSLSQRLARIVKTMRGEARLTEANTQEMLREIRIALLEADVALPVVRDFIAQVKEKALGQEVLGSLSPGQALVGIVNRELAATMGAGQPGGELNLAAQPPAVVLMAGLQGAGKTTTVDAATSLMDAGEAAGVQMPFGCRMGICQSCVVGLLKGHVRDLRTGVEHEPGTRVQTCISAASGDCVLDA